MLTSILVITIIESSKIYILHISILALSFPDDLFDCSSLDRWLVHKMDLDTWDIPRCESWCHMCISYFFNESINASNAVVKLFSIPFCILHALLILGPQELSTNMNKESNYFNPRILLGYLASLLQLSFD